MTPEDRQYHLRVRALADELVGDSAHYHWDGTFGRAKPRGLRECFDPSDDALSLWDFITDHAEGYSYSSYTWDSDHTTFSIVVPLTCDNGPATIELARDDDFEKFDLGLIVRKLLAVEVE